MKRPGVDREGARSEGDEGVRRPAVVGDGRDPSGFVDRHEVVGLEEDRYVGG